MVKEIAKYEILMLQMIILENIYIRFINLFILDCEKILNLLL